MVSKKPKPQKFIKFLQGGESKVQQQWLEGALLEGGREEQGVGGVEEEEGR